MALKDDVVLRLGSLGYTVAAEDDWAVDFCISKTERHIKNFCNITVIPDALYEVEIDMVCGEFLLAKNATTDLLSDLGNGEGIITTSAVQNVALGDTRVEFATDSSSEAYQSPEHRLSDLIDYYLNGCSSCLVAFRRLRW